jgi:N-acetylglucosaminyldiphosphoundecaprenol N-acetyl-beta-D-mannosaminyltransferase
MAATHVVVPSSPVRPPFPVPGQTPQGAGPVTPLPSERVHFGRAPVDCVTMASATAWLRDALGRPRSTPQLVMGPNAFLVNLAQRDARFAEALAHASLCLPDGMSVVWAARLVGARIPERVTGGEFMERMCELAAADGRSVYLLGGLPGAAEGAARALLARYPDLEIAGVDCPEPGFESAPLRADAVLHRIRAVKPDLLFVALGAPKQEIWMLENCLSLPIGAALSVGAAFDTQAGLRKRAPQWTHQIGAEWLYRLAMEPRRLWRRYLVGNAAFAVLIGREWFRYRRQEAAREMLRSH